MKYVCSVSGIPTGRFRNGATSAIAIFEVVMYSRFYVCMLALVVSIPNYATESREEIEIFEDSALYSRDKQVIFDQLININECR